MKLSDLLQQNECEWLDFKQEFHDNNVKLLYDIICLANTNTDADRYLLFGLEDNKTIVGIENIVKKFLTQKNNEKIILNGYLNIYQKEII